MAKLCPSCGAKTLPEARFCRVCGGLLRRSDEAANGKQVAPGARTLPLSNDARPTRGITPDDPQASAADTAKVRRTEMEEMLRRPHTSQPSAHAGDGLNGAADNDIHRSAPPTNELTPLPDIPPTAAAPQAAPVTTSQPRTTRRRGRAWLVAFGLLLGVALLAGLFALLSSRRRAPSTANTSDAPPAPASDQKRLIDEQLAEAAALMAAGSTSEAIARLRSVIELDPMNAEAHRRLGEALDKSGERREAMEEYRAAASLDQNNAEAWRSLAAAQFAEGLFNDAAESYRRFIVLKGEAEVDDQTRLDYAEALLLAGRTEEARAIYQKVAASESEDAARKAKRQLAQLPSVPLPGASPSPQPSRSPQDDLQTQNGDSEYPPIPMPSMSPTPVPNVPTPPTTTTTVPAPANGAQAQRDPDAYYQLGLNIIGGRDLKSLPRAQLLQALEYFQRAQSGSHRAAATRYVQQLGREYDRRKQQGQP